MSQSAIAHPTPVSTWRKVVVAILDFIFVMFIVGYGIGYMTGNVTDEGFNLQGAPAFIALAIIVLYFIVFTRYLGGTLFQRLLGVR